MKSTLSTLTKMLCQFMVVALALLPFQSAQAGMIGTDQILTTSAAQAERTTVLNYLSRADTIKQFESLGLDPQSANDRVAAMTDEEVRSLAGKIDSQPAGSSVALVILVVFFIWYFAFRR